MPKAGAMGFVEGEQLVGRAVTAGQGWSAASEEIAVCIAGPPSAVPARSGHGLGARRSSGHHIRDAQRRLCVVLHRGAEVWGLGGR